MGNIPRSTAIRDKHRSIIRRGKPPCAICGEAIDYSLPYLHPAEYVVDHIVSLAYGGADTLANKQAAHRKCNRDKGKGERPPLLTGRSWDTQGG